MGAGNLTLIATKVSCLVKRNCHFLVQYTCFYSSDVQASDAGIYGCEDPIDKEEMYKVVKVAWH